MNSRLLQASDQALIRQFQLAVQHRSTGMAMGEQRSPALGGGIEFADYREYRDGDDIRQVDWAVFLRFRQLLVKLAAEEKDLTLMIILDNSRSMNFGNPDKFRRACQIAALLAGIALEGGNSAGILTWGMELRQSIRPVRGARNLAWICQILEQLPLVNQVNAELCLRQFSAQYGRRCMAVLISDLLFPEWEAVLTGLETGGNNHVIQILAPSELDPDQQGEVTYVDMEDDSETPLHVDAGTLAAYQQARDSHIRDVALQCHQRNVHHHLLSSATPLSQVFYDQLRKGGLVC